jgi:hypothetical protein
MLLHFPDNKTEINRGLTIPMIATYDRCPFYDDFGRCSSMKKQKVSGSAAP